MDDGGADGAVSRVADGAVPRVADGAVPRVADGAVAPDEPLLMVMSMAPETWLPMAMTCRRFRDILIGSKRFRRLPVAPEWLMKSRALALWGVSIGMPITGSMLRAAYACGDVGVISAIPRDAVPLRQCGELARAAAAGGHIDALEHDPRVGTALFEACDGAASTGQIRVLEWCVERVGDELRAVEQAAMWKGARCGRVDVMCWSATRGYLPDSTAARQAALGGHAAAFIWACRNGAHCNSWTLAALAERADMGLIRWAYEHIDVRFDGMFSETAARMGRLDVLQWAWLCGIPCTRVVENAARFGKIDVLWWARERGLAFTSHAVENAVVSGCVPALQMMLDSGVESPDSNMMAACACASASPDMLTFVADLGYRIDPDLAADSAARKASLGALRWAASRGANAPFLAGAWAAATRNPDILREMLFLDRRPPIFVAVEAADGECLDALEVLLQSKAFPPKCIIGACCRAGPPIVRLWARRKLGGMITESV
jgi:hypothetical protein